MKIHLPNSAHLHNLGAFIRGYSPDGGDELTVSSHDKYIHLHPAALAMIACAGAKCQKSGNATKGLISKVSSSPYLVRIGLYNALGIDPAIAISEHEESGRFIPLTPITNRQDYKKTIASIIPLLHATPFAARAIFYIFSELGRNVLEHSNSPSPAYVCAQYFPEKKKVAIGIADCGVGVLSSIRRSHSAVNYEAATYLALTAGISGATPKIGGHGDNAGAGLFFTKSIAQVSDNYFIFYSGDTLFKLLKADGAALSSDPKFDRHLIVKDLPHWQGTVVGVDISVNEGQEFDELLKQIYSAYRIHVREKKKE